MFKGVLRDQSTINPLGTINITTKFLSNLSNICQDISMKSQCAKLMGGAKGKVIRMYLEYLSQIFPSEPKCGASQGDPKDSRTNRLSVQNGTALQSVVEVVDPPRAQITIIYGVLF